MTYVSNLFMVMLELTVGGLILAAFEVAEAILAACLWGRGR
jgi:hypothetical protein